MLRQLLGNFRQFYAILGHFRPLRPFEAISNNPKTSLSPRWVHVHSGRESHVIGQNTKLTWCAVALKASQILTCCLATYTEFKSACVMAQTKSEGAARRQSTFRTVFPNDFHLPRRPPRPFGGPQKAKKPEKTLGKAKVTALGLSGSPQAPPGPFGGPQKAKKPWKTLGKAKVTALGLHGSPPGASKAFRRP